MTDTSARTASSPAGMAEPPSPGGGGVAGWARKVGRKASFDTLLMPVVVTITLALLLIPLAFLVFASFRSAGPGAPNATFTLDNWRFAFGDDGLGYLLNSAKLGAVVALFTIPIGVLLAWLTTRTNMPGRRLLDNLLLVPLLFSPLLTTMAWISLAGPNAGALTTLSREWLGVDLNVFDIYSFRGLVSLLVLHFVPFMYLAVRSTLLSMDRDLEDSSRMLGARWMMTIRRITLPITAPAVIGTGFLIFVLAADDLSVSSLIGVNAGYLTIPYGIYQSTSTFPSYPTRAGALGIMLMALSMVGMYLYLRTTRRSSRFVTTAGKGGRAEPIRLSTPGKLGALAVVVLYLTLAVALPYAALLVGSFSDYFTITNFSFDLLTLENYRLMFTSPDVVTALKNTLILVLVAGGITTALAAIISWMSVRGRYGKRTLQFLSAVPIMIPGIALGVGIFWATVFLPTGLYGTLVVLVIAYAIRFMGHGTRIISSSLMQIHPELEEAARTLGSSRLRTFRTVTVGLLRAPLASAFVLIAIFCSLELSSSVLLYTSKTQPASVYVWLSAESGVVSEAFAAGAFFSTVTFVIVIITQWRFRILDRL